MEKGEEFSHTEALNDRGVRSHQRTEDSNDGGNELNDNLQNGKHGFDDGDEKREEDTCRPNRKDGNDVSNCTQNKLEDAEDGLRKSFDSQNNTVNVLKDRVKFGANQRRKLRNGVKDGSRELVKEVSDNGNSGGGRDKGLQLCDDRLDISIKRIKDAGDRVLARTGSQLSILSPGDWGKGKGREGRDGWDVTDIDATDDINESCNVGSVSATRERSGQHSGDEDSKSSEGAHC